MKVKEKIIPFVICLIIIIIYVIGNYQNVSRVVNKVYKVYLNGENIGTITDKNGLFALIDGKQKDIKEKYNVKNVYPPSDLQVIESYSYNNETTDLNTLYNKIEESQEFTILGYEIKVSASSDHDEYSIFVLDKKIFSDAVKKYIMAFVDEKKYNEYLAGTQKDLEDEGLIYQSMGIKEEIFIKEKYISTNAKIYENSEELAKDLLFGFNHQEQSYTVKSGDTIESISESHTLNTQEFLIANPNYSSKDSLLAIGEKVNVTLIKPELSFAYTVLEKREIEQDFEKEIIRDNTKDSSYSEITTPGVKGLKIQVSNYEVVNGEPNTNVDIIDEIVVRKTVNQVTTKGRKSAPGSGVFGNQYYLDTGSGWRWPTDNPYRVTSEFAPRWGRHHDGIDISGAGKGSNIFASNDGVVVKVVKSCPNNGSYPNSCGGGYGNHVIIDHGNNIYTIYAHLLVNVEVSEGQTVTRGTVVGHMGNSGQSKGVHLHFGLSIGYPGRGGVYKNPRELFK